MVCFSPIKGYRSKTLNPNGKRSIVFNRADGFVDLPITLACGNCPGCRLERSRQWAVRCTHEADTHECNSFITLTYNDQYLPTNGSLNLRHFQKFMKRLRFKVGKLRFYHCGEYGEKYGRPHYHAIIFGYDFPDKYHYMDTNGLPLYRSPELEQLWPYGFSSIGQVTFQSAAYVARYILKKINGEQAENHYKKPYEHIDPETGEIFNIEFDLQPEYTTMSRNHGIGHDWLKQFNSDVFPSDEIIMNGKKMRPPKYYDQQFELLDPKSHQAMKGKRKRKAIKHSENNTPARLRVRLAVLQSKLKQLPRNVE